MVDIKINKNQNITKKITLNKLKVKTIKADKKQTNNNKGSNNKSTIK